MNNSTDHTARCVCGHTAGSHDANGCIVCQANGQRCDGFWAQSEYDDAVQSGLVNILTATRERDDLRRAKDA